MVHLPGMEFILTDKEKEYLSALAEKVLITEPNEQNAAFISALLSHMETNEMDDGDKRCALWCMTISDLYERGRLDVLKQNFGLHQLEVSVSFPVLPLKEKRSLSQKLRQKDKTPSRKLYISDMHFYHNALNKQMDCRGFKNHEEMNAYMIEQWNKKVTKKDEVYILGDLSIAKGKATNEIVRQLNGRLYLIQGNHDSFLSDKEFDKTRFRWIKPYAEIKDNHRLVVLSHYPVFCYNRQYAKNEEGKELSYMLYGHVHNTQDEKLVNHFIMETRQTRVTSKYETEPAPIPCHMINCFCMFSDYQPLTLDEWIKVDEKRRTEMNQKETENK